MSSQDRRQREKHETQDKILAAARDLFLNHGFDSVSMRKIADAIEYTPAALYVHFKDKVELMRELCRRDFAAMDRDVIALGSLADPVRRIHEAGRIYISFGISHQNQYRLMFMTPHPREVLPTDEDLKLMMDPDQNGYAFMCKAVAEAAGAGRLRPEFADLHATVQTLWAGIHGVVALEITHGQDPCVPMQPIAIRSELSMIAQLRGMLRPDDAYHPVLDKVARELARQIKLLPQEPIGLPVRLTAKAPLAGHPPIPTEAAAQSGIAAATHKPTARTAKRGHK